MKNKNTNRLIHSTSPYLLQHAYNPVDWFEWSDEALQKARQEDKPILVSIGYSSCHWCHVMERESFEIEDIAAVMNEFFVCIKVDREERPDIDQVYMDAVQALGINGGWPLNVFLTPEQKPFFGGTYFSPTAWVQILQNIHKAFQVNRTQIEDSAEELRHHLLRSDVERFRQKPDDAPLLQDLEDIYKKLDTRFDNVWGGLDKAPKFVMPSIWLFLLRYYYMASNEQALNHVLLTLRKIAMGGIYDQIGGGFSRYSVDGRWFAPHFEKMLYDNAQLMSLYAEAYTITKDVEFKTVIEETFDWLQREMTGTNGGFYSALDADSEGEEGKYYVWTENDLKGLLKHDEQLISKYYNVQAHGNWEHGNNILFRNKMDQDFLQENSLSQTSWSSTLKSAKQILLDHREQRIKPGLDDKIITGWNAMMIGGLIDAYKALRSRPLLDVAKRNLQFLSENLVEGTIVYRSFKGKHSTTQGFLDDYAYLTQAYLKMYQVTFDENLLHQAKKLLIHTLENFYDPTDGYFFFTSHEESSLISRKKEIFDNVIPSSNALMAQNLFQLGILFDHDEWKKKATDMVEPLSRLIKSDPNYMSQWAIVFTEIKKGMAEVVLLGTENGDLRAAFQEKYHPFSLFMGTENTSTLPLLTGKTIQNGKSTIFVCYNKTCQQPVHTVPDAEKMLL